MIRGYIRSLSREIRVQRVILFGSWARGDYLDDSDIDLIVLSNDFEGVPFEDRLVILQKHWNDERCGVALEAFGYTQSEFRELQRYPHLAREARRKGLVIA
jgi:predicted nucleotidyltransferase